MQSDTQTISIPLEASGSLFEEFQLSERIAKALAANGFGRLMDLDGWSPQALLRLPGWTANSVAELRALLWRVDQMRKSPRPPLPRDESSYASRVEGIYEIPDHARKLFLWELPLSHRLEIRLRVEGMNALGDVHGMTKFRLRIRPGVGAKTLKEFDGILHRAAMGEFQVDRAEIVRGDKLVLLRRIDQIIASLPQRDIVILESRLCAIGPRMEGLRRMAERLSMTARGVRQLELDAFSVIRREGGARVRLLLEQIPSFSRQPWTLCQSEVFSWLGDRPWTLKYKPVFYCKLLDEVWSEIQTFPTGRNDPPTPVEQLRTIARAAERILTRFGPLTFHSGLYPLFRRHFRRLTSRPLTLLRALTQDKAFDVLFSKEAKTVVKLKGQQLDPSPSRLLR